MVDAVNIKSMTSTDLRTLQKEIDRELATRSETEKRTLWEEFKAKAEGIGSSVEHIVEWAQTSAKSATTKNPAPIKYRGPNDTTWTGRGKPPTWLKILIDAGHSKEEFSVDKPADESTDTEPALSPEFFAEGEQGGGTEEPREEEAEHTETAETQDAPSTKATKRKAASKRKPAE